MKKSCCLLLLLLLNSTSMKALIAHLLPTPKEVTIFRCTTDYPQHFCFKEGTPPRLLAAFTELMGETPSFTDGLPVTIVLEDSIEGAYDYPLLGFNNEAYTLKVDSQAGILISAVTETGAIRAFQTLAQLCEGGDDERSHSALASRPSTLSSHSTTIQCCYIRDWPSFKLRGYMHDVGRSFISFDELKHQLRLLARFKVNTFHWHLTENQAWRFEVKRYPQLTEASTMTRFAGCYYTQEQCRELDSLAYVLGVTVIPEIDMPGHSQAFQRAMGYNMQTAKGVEALKSILSEVAATFSHAPYIHIGADEQQITYLNFLQTMTDHVHALGKKVVVWNPIQGKTITATSGADMTQMWSSAGKVVAGLPNIDCRYNYVNHFDVFADLAGIYLSNIYYVPQGNADVAGSITAVWNDRYITSENAIMRQNNVYANILASAERAWKGGGEHYIEEGGARLPWEGSAFEEFHSWEERFLYHKSHVLAAEPIPYVRQTDVVWKITDAFPNDGDPNAVFPPETEGLKDSYDFQGKTYGTGVARGAAVYLRHVWGTLVPGYYANPQMNQTAYAWTYIYSPTEQEAGALIEFQNYARSEQDITAENGKWDRRGSRLWLNNEEIVGPEWDNAGKTIDKEVPLGNENLTARPPVIVRLKQGWNTVFMKLPYVSTPGVRLNKWMFTFVLTDQEGREALNGIVYSTTADPTQGISETPADTDANATGNRAYDVSGKRSVSSPFHGSPIIKGGKKLL